MRSKTLKIFRKQVDDKYEVYFVFYTGLMCSGIVIFEETEKNENGMVFVEAKKIDCSYSEVVAKMQALSLTCVREDKFVFEDVEYAGYKTVFHNYRKIGNVVTMSGYRTLAYRSSPRVVSVVETYMPKKDFYHIVKNREVLIPADCLRDNKFYRFFADYAKKTDEMKKIELDGLEYNFFWMNFNQSNFCGALYLGNQFQKLISYSDYMNR